MTTIADFYVIGGTLRRDAPSYVRRQADDDLYDGLSAGEFCYVLTSRQMGKSSLMVRTAGRLRAEGIAVAVLDLTAIGQNVTAEQWYEGLLGIMGQQLDLEDELDDFWANNKTLGPLQRWMQAIVDCVLARGKGRLVIFVDEIDAVRSLPFSTNEFFAGIREFYNRRTQDPETERLTFCLLGVATPSDLVRDIRTTPFNIGRRIELQDFTISDVEPLGQGLGRDEKIAAQVLKRVLYWTEGHPYLTQRLCQALAEDQSVTTAAGVDHACQELFLSARARERDDNLLFVRERVLRSEEADRISLLDLYLQIRKRKKVPDDEANPLVSVLRLSGIARVVDGYLQVRNRIYYQAFDQTWVRANMPDAELQRQRRAYRTGQMRAAAIAAIIITVLTGSVTFAALKERNRAVEATHRADITNLQLQEVLKQLQIAVNYAKQGKDIADQKSKQTDEQRLKAEEQKELAELQRIDAERQRLIADQRSKEAQTQRLEAENQRREADHLRSIAESAKSQIEQQSTGDQADRLSSQGAYDKAEPLYRKYLNFLRQKYGSNHPSIPKVLSALAETYEALGDYAKAEPLYREALSIAKVSPGSTHPDTLRIMESEAAVLRKLQREPEALPLEAFVTRIRSSRLTGAFSGTIMSRTIMNKEEPIDRASIQFTNLGTGVPTATRTDLQGYFYKDKLLPGAYSIRISAPGFKEVKVRGFVFAGENSRLATLLVELEPQENQTKPN